jgi:hypothetical protein
LVGVPTPTGTQLLVGINQFAQFVDTETMIQVGMFGNNEYKCVVPIKFKNRQGKDVTLLACAM